ncbi:MAG: YhjD/YihY/BrkB family envelope integrity protein, partial [Planctomycetota bacterium]
MSQQPPSSRSIIDRFLAERDQLRRAIEVTGLAFRGVARSDIPRMAAALAYRTIFSLIPVLVVGLAVAGSFVKPDQVRSQVERLLEVTGLSEITVSQGVLEPGADTNTESDTLSSDDEDARDSDIGNANNADGTPPDSVTGGVPGAPAEGTEGRLASDASPEAGVSIGQASALDPMTEEQLR